MTRRPWTSQDIATLRAIYAETPTAKAERLLRGENEVLKDLIAGAADELGDFPPSKRWIEQFVKRAESALAAKGE